VNLGLLPGAGGTQRLPRLIGEAKTLELILLGKTVGPQEAADLGLVHACVAAPVLEHAMAMAERLAAKPPRAMAHCKRLVRRALSTSPEQGLADERTLFCDLMVDDESFALMQDFNRGRRDIRDRD